MATTTGTVTRAAVTATKPISEVAGYNQAAGTISVHTNTTRINTGGTQTIIHIDDGGTTDRIRITQFSTSNFGVSTTSVGNAASSTVTAATGNNKLIFGYETDNAVIGINGTLDPTPDTSADFPLGDNVTIIRLGHDPTPASYINDHIGLVELFNKRLEDNTLINEIVFLEWLFEPTTRMVANDNRWHEPIKLAVNQ